MHQVALILSAHTESIKLSALPTESIIVSAPPAESMILSAPCNLQVLRLGVGAIGLRAYPALAHLLLFEGGGHQSALTPLLELEIAVDQVLLAQGHDKFEVVYAMSRHQPCLALRGGAVHRAS